MDPQGNNQPPPLMMVGDDAPLAYGSSLYQSNPMIGNPIPGSVGGIHPTSQFVGGQFAQSSTPHLVQHQIAYQQMQQQKQQQLQQQLQNFWANQYQEIDKVADFKNHSLPLARIKKIMKADEDVRMISAEAPVVFARACEMFVLELTLRAWNHTEENKRRTLQKNDIGAAITSHEIFDFLVDIVPREDLKDEVVTSVQRGTVPVAGPPDGLAYYMPPQHPPHVGTPGMIMGRPMMDPTMYAVQQPQMPYMAQQMWQQPPGQQQQPPDQQQPPVDR